MPLRTLRRVQQRTAAVPRGRFLLVSLGLAAASAVAVRMRRRTSELPVTTPRRCLHPLTVQAISGATAEVCENLLGYPFSTLRVKCQAHGLSTWTVLRQLQTQGSARAAIRTLYSGVGPTTIGAVLIGAIYLSSFTYLNDQLYAARQHFALRTAKRKSLLRYIRNPEHSSSSSHNDDVQSEHRRLQHRLQTSSTAGSHSESECYSARDFKADPPRLLTDFLAAVLASMSTALIEGPLDVFQNRVQAGSACGGIASSMHAAVHGGIGPLFYGLNGFLLRGITRDVAELVAYSQLRELKKPSMTGKFATGIQRLPDEISDIILGASAGAMAVLLSMPLTCIKTVIDTSTAAPPSGLLPTVKNFWVTGHGLVRVGGPGALFRGLLPQMVETIPSVGMYWLAVECTRRALAPYTIVAAKNTSMHLWS